MSKQKQGLCANCQCGRTPHTWGLTCEGQNCLSKPEHERCTGWVATSGPTANMERMRFDSDDTPRGR